MESAMANTFWSIVPPLIAIVLALVTKEVISSLVIGVLAGVLFYTNFNVYDTLEMTFSVIGEQLGGNASIILFLCLLGVIVVLMTKAGGSRAYGEWAKKTIKTRRGALLATTGLGALIFIDDYFNCLTVGTVMRPVTDSHNVSRAKLAYLIDATAAPICIIAPISSWAVSVASYIEEGGLENGFQYFLKTIPYNLYAILTILMMVLLAVFSIDFSKMRKFEQNAIKNNDVYTTKEHEFAAGENTTVSDKGKVFDLVIPVVMLIVLSIVFMLVTGAKSCAADGISPTLVNLFGNASVNSSIIMASFLTILFMMLLYLPRKVMTFKEFMTSVTEGIKSMVPAIIILCLAWTLSSICNGYLGAGAYVGGVIRESGMTLKILPAIVFLVAGALAFSIGSSWSVFGILVPIVIAIFGGVDSTLLTITISAVLGGAVCGDHISPISDTTIMSSTGAECNHIDHVGTQLPYALTVYACCFVSYIFAGFIQNPWIVLLIGIALLVGTLLTIKTLQNKKASTEETKE